MNAPGAGIGGAIPADVLAVLSARCWLCHGARPRPGVPVSLVTRDDFTRPSGSDPTMTVAQVVVARITTADAQKRMPPPPANPATSAEVQTLQAWIGAGTPLVPSPADGGSVDAAPDPFGAPPQCTSGVVWTSGTSDSPLMQPGEPCLTCHSNLGFAGTVYPTAHEPSQCYGANGTTTAARAQVVVLDSSGNSFTAEINAAGNFNSPAVVVPPLRAKVLFMGRERVMIGAVPDGNCNGCHTQLGTTTAMDTTVPAPGRIILP
jgi:hypothetical protein